MNKLIFQTPCMAELELYGKLDQINKLFLPNDQQKQNIKIL